MHANGSRVVCLSLNVCVLISLSQRAFGGVNRLRTGPQVSTSAQGQRWYGQRKQDLV